MLAMRGTCCQQLGTLTANYRHDPDKLFLSKIVSLFKIIDLQILFAGDAPPIVDSGERDLLLHCPGNGFLPFKAISLIKLGCGETAGRVDIDYEVCKLNIQGREACKRWSTTGPNIINTDILLAIIDVKSICVVTQMLFEVMSANRSSPVVQHGYGFVV